jgi:phosphoribosylanthranilate isomerase
MVEIKICGITNLEDAYLSIDCGADALGFIFYPKSLRYVAPGRAKEIIEKLPSGIAKVGVFVNQEVGEVKEITGFCRLDLIQLHGDESPGYCNHFPASSLIKAISRGKGIRRGEHYSVRAFLVDARERGFYGGTGQKSDWGLTRRLKETHPVILAGGLKRENIEEAIRIVGPRAVDINSGVEISPGKKDPGKVSEIIRLVREMGRKESDNREDIFRVIKE